MANENLGDARKTKNDEFYTQYQDIEKEMNAYLEFNPDVFRGKTVLLPCDDPEWSNFTKFFAQKFQSLGLKKLISTSYAPNSKATEIPYQPTLFELESPDFDEEKTYENGKIFTLTADNTGDDVINFDDLEWSYLEGDGDFRSDEIKALLDEADICLTNPPFSLYREFMAWLVEANKDFVIVGNMNAITYKEVFPLIKENRMWLGNGFNNGNAFFSSPMNKDYASGVFDAETGLVKFRNVVWFSTLEHGRRHQPLSLMTMSENIKFNKAIKDLGYLKYDNYDAIEVPRTEAIPSDYEGVMGVPISFLSKYNPDQFEIIGLAQISANELGIKPVGQKFVDDYYAQGNKGQITAKWNNLVYHIGEKVVVPYQRILIRHKKVAR